MVVAFGGENCHKGFLHVIDALDVGFFRLGSSLTDRPHVRPVGLFELVDRFNVLTNRNERVDLFRLVLFALAVVRQRLQAVLAPRVDFAHEVLQLRVERRFELALTLDALLKIAAVFAVHTLGQLLELLALGKAQLLVLATSGLECARLAIGQARLGRGALGPGNCIPRVPVERPLELCVRI